MADHYVGILKPHAYKQVLYYIIHAVCNVLNLRDEQHADRNIEKDAIIYSDSGIEIRL